MSFRVWKNLLLSVLIVGFAFKGCAVFGEDKVEDNGCNEYDVCLPGAEDIAVAPRTVTASNTCGNPPGKYCQIGPESTCSWCNSTSKHPADFMIDRSEGYSGSNFSTWWQSQTWWEWYNIQEEDPLKVNVSLAFNKSYIITGEILITFSSNKPSKMVLEKSVDFGKSWLPLQYFADDCLRKFNMEASSLNCSTDKVLCTEKYSDLSPGTVYFSFLNCYTKKTFWDRKTQELTYATNLRLRLEFPGTDGFHILKDEERLNRYYYAISDIKVFGRCQCSGHAPNCMFPKNGHGYFNTPSCICQHHTAGINCERCEPLYNNKAWMPATSETEPNPCQRCECYEHASSCVFNGTLGHGVCNNCNHNTTGYFCEQCKDKFYRNLSKPLSDPDVCLDCNCALEGVTNNGSCSQRNSTIGQCMCKENVTGRRCDRCKDAYYGFTLPPFGNCVACNCNEHGTVNGSLNCGQLDGLCSCKSNIHLSTCSQCKLGFYGFPNSTDGDCLECTCDYGGSTYEICEKSQGKCLCRNGVQGDTCSQVTENRFFPRFDYILFEAEYQYGKYNVTSNISTYNEYFTGRGYATISAGENIDFSVSVDVPANYSIVLRYSKASGNVHIHVKGDMSKTCPAIDQNISTSGLLSDGQGLSWKSRSTFMLCPGRNYTIRVSSDQANAKNFSIVVDSLVLIPEFAGLRSYKNMFSLTDACVENVTTIQSARSSSRNCRSVAFSVMVELYNGSLACECSEIGAEKNTSCDPYGGQCQCKRGVMGRTCDKCQPGYYNLTKNGCTPCDCNSDGSHNPICDPVSGKCLCKHAVEGRTCDRCRINYFGLHTGEGCSHCNCSTIGSLNATCDGVTGKCYCKPGVEEELVAKCDRCKANYFNFTEAGCLPCNCNKAGSRLLQCHASSGVCPCKINTEGDKCDRCYKGTFALEESNPSGCTPCFCFNRTRNCSAAEGFISITTVESNLTVLPDSSIRLAKQFTGNQLRSYGRVFEVSATGDSNDTGDFELHINSSRHSAILRLTANQCRSLKTDRYCVLLHETNSKEKLTAYAMQSLLVDVEEMTLKVTGTVGGGLSNITVVVSMGSAQHGVGSERETAYHVEKCACPESYKSLSCESCSPGFTRDIANANSFVGCSPCSCNNRSKNCHPETRVCRNCRLSEGDFCERCQYGVDLSTGCSTCLPEYWSRNITRHGCQACNCFLDNTVNHNSSVCEDSTGQCSCKAYVGGLQCTRCDDNYYNITHGTIHGCRECPICYGLIQNHVRRLRDAVRDFEDLTETLVERFNNAGRQQFAQRLRKAEANVSRVFEKANLTDNQDTEDLNITLEELERIKLKVESLKIEVGILTEQQKKLDEIVENTSNWTKTTFQLLKNASSSIPLIESLANTIKDFLQPMEHWKTQINQFNKTFWEISHNLSVKSEVELRNIERVESDALSSRLNLTELTNSLLGLQNKSDALFGTGKKIKELSENYSRSASGVLGMSKDVLDSAKKLTELIETNRNLARTLQLYNQTVDYSSLERNASNAIKDSSHQSALSNQVLNESVILLTDAEDAHREAISANDSASKTLEDARTTLLTLQQFKNLSEHSEQIANESLQQISTTNSNSQRSIENIMNISDSIQEALDSVNKANDLAKEADNLSRAENENVTFIYNRTKALEKKKDLSVCSRDLVTNRKDATTNRSKSLEPALASCPKDEAKNASKLAIVALTHSEETKGVTDDFHNDVSSIHQDVLKTKDAVKNIEATVTSRTRPTKIRVQDDSFQRLREELKNLRQAKEKKAVFIKQLRTKVKALQEEIKDLESLRDSLRDLPPCGPV